MNVKKCWISTAIVLAVYLFGFCNAEALAAEKISYQEKSVNVSQKYSRSTVARTGSIDKAVYNQSRHTADLSALTFHTTFSEAIDILRNSTEPPLKIVVLWRDLSENTNVERDTPIKIDGFSGGIRLRTCLELLLMAVSSGFARLDYVVKDGIIIIATKDSLLDKMRTRVYDISYLVAAPARFGFGFQPGFGRGWPAEPYMGRAGRSNQRAGRMADLLRGNVRPNRWR
jgi:hypothetical protein